MMQYAKYMLLVVASLMTTSCLIYKPQLADVPLIDHKGDVLFASSVYIKPEPAVSATLSAGLTNHVAMQFYVNNDFQSVYYSHIAIGLYFPKGNHVTELYLGSGRGEGNAYVDADPASADGPYSCHFLQLNHGWHLTPKVTVGAAMKGDLLYTEKIRWSNPDCSGRDNAWHLLLEPQLVFRIGGEHMKFQVQVGYDYLSNRLYRPALIYPSFSISTGISYSL